MALKICFQLSGTIFVSVINCRLESKENLVLSHFWLQCCKHLCAGGPTLLKSPGQYNVILIILLYFSSFFYLCVVVLFLREMAVTEENGDR